MKFSIPKTGLLILLTINMLSMTGLQIPVHAVTQSGQSTWSPFGPSTNTLILQFYSDFLATQNAFKAGSVDITDWPAFGADLPVYASNPDFFLASQQSEFGIFQLDINHHPAFLGTAQQTPRTTSIPGVINSTAVSTSSCPTGFGRLNVILVNKEEANALVKDPLNKVTAAGPQTFTVTDSDNAGLGEPDGNYTLPSNTSCMLAGKYNIIVSAYAGTGAISIGSAQIVTVTLGVNYNSPSTVKSTQAGTEMRRALAHLLDKPEFILGTTLQGRASCDDIFAPPSQSLPFGSCNPSADKVPSIPRSVLDEDCADHPWFNPGICHPLDAYLLNNSLVGPGQLWWANSGSVAGSSQGYPSTTDIRAACDHFVIAGFAITPAGATCLDVANASVGISPKPGYPHLVASSQVTFYIRTHAPRKAFGQIIADSLNFLFGTANNGGTLGAVPTNVACVVNYGFKSAAPGCIPQYYTISDISNIVFGDGTAPDTWGLYTGGFSLSSTPDDMYSLLHSQFAANICGGVPATFPNNYRFYCNPVYDGRSSAGEFAGSLSEASSFFSDAALIAHRTLANIPVFSRYEQFVALNAWNWKGSSTPLRSSLVNGLGTGFLAGSTGGLWSLLNMRCNTAYVPQNVAYKCGGGMPGIIRRSESQDTHNLSPFQSTTVWEFDVINSVYDSMLQANPLTGGTGLQLVDWMTTFHTSTFNPLETSCLRTACANGTTTQIWHLRNDLRFHDGVRLTADDVVFSILALRDVPSANFQPNVVNVASATALDSATVQVKLILQSPFYEVNIGSIPILPKHIWAPLCGNPIGAPGNKCADPTFDPMSAGIFIGSGPWVCKNISTGAVGGSCSQNADGSLGGQAVALGGRIVLRSNTNYMRGPAGLQGTSLQALSWADKNDDGVVSILDLADAAFRFGQTDPYWGHPLFGAQPGFVDIGDISTIAFYFGHGVTSPYLPSQLTGLDPQIDPFNIDLTGMGGPLMYYEGGALNSGALAIKLVSLSGVPNPAAFSATLTSSAGTVVGTATGAAGGSAVVVLLSFSGITPGSYQLQIAFNSGNVYTISLNL